MVTIDQILCINLEAPVAPMKVLIFANLGLQSALLDTQLGDYLY